MQALWQKINETFIIQNRYLFFVEGLKTTLLLTFASFFFGTVVGVLLCAGARSKNRFFQKLTSLLRGLFINMPTLVLLMILVYVVFGRSAVPILVVVSIGLMMKSGAYLSEIFESALSTVATGEIEAARTLGMSKWQAFRYVVLPQTVKAALPLYENQFIVSMQETSVVGYLAIVDLTRASSIISSRTLDAFFGLITVSILYFIIGRVARMIFRAIDARMTRMNKGEVSA